MSELDIIIITISVIAMALSITSLVLVFTRKPDEGHSVELDELRTKLGYLHNDYLKNKSETQKEFSMHLREMMGRIDRLNEAVFNKRQTGGR